MSPLMEIRTQRIRRLETIWSFQQFVISCCTDLFWNCLSIKLICQLFFERNVKRHSSVKRHFCRLALDMLKCDSNFRTPVRYKK